MRSPPAEERLSQRLAQQSAIAELGRSAISGTGFEELVNQATVLIADALPVDGAAVVEVMPGRRELLVRSETTGGLRGRRVAVSGSWPGVVLDNRQPLVVTDSRDGPPVSPAFDGLGIRSGVVVPIGRPGEESGLLGVYGRRPYSFGGDDVHFLEAMANVLAETARRETIDAELRRMAMHDVVTGLPNRALLDDRMRQSLAYARRADLRVAVMFIDLDAFKVVNDSLGHDAGDEVLRVVGGRLEAAVRSSDTVARFGGDEFVIVAGALEDEGEACRLAEKLLGTLAAPVPVAGQSVHVRASVGICLSCPALDPEPLALIRSADQAMYRAKARGRNRYELSVTEGAALTDRLGMERDLRAALTGGDLRLVVQPFVRLAGRIPAGAEVLLRWQHPEKGYIRPGEFLDVAEQSGLMIPIGEWALRTACRHAVRWQHDGFLLTVNLSAGQLSHPGVVNMIERALEDTGLAPACLGLELTEHVLFGDEAEIHATLSRLKGLGVKLLLDDFGTGFSSLSHLKRFPIDVVKIDRSFVEGLGRKGPGDGDAAIIGAILGMSRAMGKQVIPEGVETREQAEDLARLGCELGQGYFFSCPMKVRMFDSWLAQAPGTA